MAERDANLATALNSLLFNLHLSKCPADEHARFRVLSDAKSRSIYDSMRTHGLIHPPTPSTSQQQPQPRQQTFAHMSLLIYDCPDDPRQFEWAKRYLVHNLYHQIETSPDYAIPLVQSVAPTPHHCIARVTVASTFSDTEMPRKTYLCFTETMELIDGEQEGVVDLAYRRLFDCDGQGRPKINDPSPEVFLSRLVKKTQTLLTHYPHGIAMPLHMHPSRMVFAQRYVFCNAKFSIHHGETNEDLPINAWLSPFEQVANLVPPRVYGSNEVFLVHCALGYSRILVLADTGQIIHNRGEARGTAGSVWRSLLRFGKETAIDALPTSLTFSVPLDMPFPIRSPSPRQSLLSEGLASTAASLSRPVAPAAGDSGLDVTDMEPGSPSGSGLVQSSASGSAPRPIPAHTQPRSRSSSPETRPIPIRVRQTSHLTHEEQSYGSPSSAMSTGSSVSAPWTVEAQTPSPRRSASESGSFIDNAFLPRSPSDASIVKILFA
ncbi:hypothetical protein BC831DRAFT_441224 [Entophlyctis helioformis]|nr:hypothetical protein BC831DRAFT_441224 [Entophlyctis helioformis]